MTELVRGVALSNSEKLKWTLGIFGDLVLKGTPCVLRVTKMPEEDEAFLTFLKKLDEQVNVYRLA